MNEFSVSLNDLTLIKFDRGGNDFKVRRLTIHTPEIRWNYKILLAGMEHATVYRITAPTDFFISYDDTSHTVSATFFGFGISYLNQWGY